MLTDQGLRALNKPRESRYEVRDKPYPLIVVVQTTGTISFQSRYGGRRRVLGVWGNLPGQMTLAKAREAALAIKANRGAVNADIPHAPPPALAGSPITSPAGPACPPALPQPTMRDAYRWWLADTRDDLSDAVVAERLRILNSDITDILDHPVTEIEHEHCDGIIQRKYDSIKAAGGAGVAANRLRTNLATFFNWCLREGRSKTGLKVSPMINVAKRVRKETPRNRWLCEREIQWMFRALTAMKTTRWNDESDQHARAIELLLRTVSRRSEIYLAQWDWLDGERLIIPRTKNGSTNVVWLSPTCRHLIGDRPQGVRPQQRIFSVNAQSTAKPVRRLRIAMSEIAAADRYTFDFNRAGSTEHWTLHDLRTTAITILGGADTHFLDQSDRAVVSPDIRSRLLNHKDQSVRSKFYDFSDSYAERRVALRRWNDWLDGVKEKSATPQT